MSEQPGDRPTDEHAAVVELGQDESPAETGGGAGPPATGVASADAAAERLAEVGEAPLEAHVDIYEDVHRRLQEGLGDLDDQ